mgnify:CR=1 FL=1
MPGTTGTPGAFDVLTVGYIQAVKVTLPASQSKLDDFGVTIDTHSMNAARFVTHLRYLYARVASGKQIVDPHPTFVDAIANAHPEATACAMKLRFQFEMNLGEKLTTDEVAYLALHIARLLWDLRDNQR